ncbi:helicase [Streptomyces phage CricKo]|nr:DNA primase/polymerase [Streptomyces phage Rainydai]QJD49938.1 helicase [Streptomyces phage CricKo]QNL30670.1 helicase [Streptomyces phage Thiqqums]
MMNPADRAVGSWNELLGVLLEDEDRKKIEWAIGAIIAGGPTKMLVITGPEKSGKSSILTLMERVIEMHREEDSLPVAVRRSGASDPDMDRFMLIEDNRPGLAERWFKIPERIIEVPTTGHTLTLNNFYLLAGFISSHMGAIATRCLATYRELGPNHYDTVRENNK